MYQLRKQNKFTVFTCSSFFNGFNFFFYKKKSCYYPTSSFQLSSSSFRFYHEFSWKDDEDEEVKLTWEEEIFFREKRKKEEQDKQKKEGMFYVGTAPWEYNRVRLTDQEKNEIRLKRREEQRVRLEKEEEWRVKCSEILASIKEKLNKQKEDEALAAEKKLREERLNETPEQREAREMLQDRLKNETFDEKRARIRREFYQRVNAEIRGYRSNRLKTLYNDAWQEYFPKEEKDARLKVSFEKIAFEEWKNKSTKKNIFELFKLWWNFEKDSFSQTLNRLETRIVSKTEKTYTKYRDKIILIDKRFFRPYYQPVWEFISNFVIGVFVTVGITVSKVLFFIFSWLFVFFLVVSFFIVAIGFFLPLGIIMISTVLGVEFLLFTFFPSLLYFSRSVDKHVITPTRLYVRKTYLGKLIRRRSFWKFLVISYKLLFKYPFNYIYNRVVATYNSYWIEQYADLYSALDCKQRKISLKNWKWDEIYFNKLSAEEYTERYRTVTYYVLFRSVTRKLPLFCYRTLLNFLTKTLPIFLLECFESVWLRLMRSLTLFYYGEAHEYTRKRQKQFENWSASVNVGAKPFFLEPPEETVIPKSHRNYLNYEFDIDAIFGSFSDDKKVEESSKSDDKKVEESSKSDIDPDDYDEAYLNQFEINLFGEDSSHPLKKKKFMDRNTAYESVKFRFRKHIPKSESFKKNEKHYKLKNQVSENYPWLIQNDYLGSSQLYGYEDEDKYYQYHDDEYPLIPMRIGIYTGPFAGLKRRLDELDWVNYVEVKVRAWSYRNDVPESGEEFDVLKDSETLGYWEAWNEFYYEAEEPPRPVFEDEDDPVAYRKLLAENMPPWMIDEGITPEDILKGKYDHRFAPEENEDDDDEEGAERILSPREEWEAEQRTMKILGWICVSAWCAGVLVYALFVCVTFPIVAFFQIINQMFKIPIVEYFFYYVGYCSCFIFYTVPNNWRYLIWPAFKFKVYRYIYLPFLKGFVDFFHPSITASFYEYIWIPYFWLPFMGWMGFTVKMIVFGLFYFLARRFVFLGVRVFLLLCYLFDIIMEIISWVHYFYFIFPHYTVPRLVRHYFENKIFINFIDVASLDVSPKLKFLLRAYNFVINVLRFVFYISLGVLQYLPFSFLLWYTWYLWDKGMLEEVLSACFEFKLFFFANKFHPYTVLIFIQTVYIYAFRFACPPFSRFFEENLMEAFWGTNFLLWLCFIDPKLQFWGFQFPGFGWNALFPITLILFLKCCALL